MNLFWALTAGLALAALQAWLFHTFNLKHVSYRRYFSKNRVFPGDKVLLVEVLSNRKMLPVPWVKVESRIPSALRFNSMLDEETHDDLHHRSVFFLSGYRQITRTYEVNCLNRGCFNVSSVTLTAGDLFGIWDRTATMNLNLEMIVYPAILPIDRVPVDSTRWQGDVVVRRFIMPDMVLINGIRAYQSGDRQKDIHWSATARNNRLMVKTHDYTTSQRMMILLNVQSSEDVWGKMDAGRQSVIEQGICYAASIAAWAVHNGVEVGFACNGVYQGIERKELFVPPAFSAQQLEDLLETMARVVVQRRISFHSYLDAFIQNEYTGYDVVIISNYWSDLLAERAAKIRAAGNTVTRVPMEGGASHEVA